MKVQWNSAQVGTAMMFIAACMAIVFRYGVRLGIEYTGEINSAMIGVTYGIMLGAGILAVTLILLRQLKRRVRANAVRAASI